MKKFVWVIVINAAVISLLTGCGADKEVQQTTDESDVLSIYTTIYPIAFFASEIGGSHVEVESILPAGSDPHTYEPTTKTMLEIAKADAFIYNGAQLETYAKKIGDALESEQVLMVEASEGIALLEHTNDEKEHQEDTDSHDEEDHSEDTHSHDEETQEDIDSHDDEEHLHDHEDADPHVWIDPIRSISLAENIMKTLIELKPEAEDEFLQNFENLKTRLEELDTDFHKLETFQNKEILVTHAAYGYWESAYGLEQIAISGISSTQEPSQKQLETIIDLVKEHDIRYLLFEQNIESKVADVIQAETEVESLNIHNLEVLTEEDINNDEDYFTLMYQNLDVLVKALQK
ncbi:metal ABC transporter solute-binding protein, Zn/Mn family [Radiobacillus sp. PE A8.2]|uniref:metal ABC transporter solute-binding protein, Zn/Mn family n=1 Tax=Radiobacillus sp. PE A8.2 TaxID=3380349 RepID=UPI00388FB408